MLWLSREFGKDKGGNSIWEVIDTMPHPVVGKDETFATFSCGMNGKLDPEIFGVAKYEEKSKLAKIKSAWRANRKAGKFETIPVKDIECENMGSGE
jgi:hypothetical protein